MRPFPSHGVIHDVWLTRVVARFQYGHGMPCPANETWRDDAIKCAALFSSVGFSLRQSQGTPTHDAKENDGSVGLSLESVATTTPFSSWALSVAPAERTTRIPHANPNQTTHSSGPSRSLSDRDDLRPLIWSSVCSGGLQSR